MNSTQMRLNLEGDDHEQFQALKKHYGLTNNSELVRLLIFKEHRKITSIESSNLFEKVKNLEQTLIMLQTHIDELVKRLEKTE